MRKKPLYGSQEKLQPLQALLLALSDDLALPLLQIKTGVEVLGVENYNRSAAKSQSEKLLLAADNGLQLIEAYKLALAASVNPDMPVEPVAIGAVLHDVAQQIYPYAKKYATEIEVDVRGRPAPVLAHLPSLRSALEVLSSSIIRAQSSTEQKKRYRVLLAAHRSGGVISTGVFSSINGLSDKTLRAARNLVGSARNPLPSLPSGAASGILIADVLCSAMWQPLRSTAHNNMHGLSTALPLSKQLNFV